MQLPLLLLFGNYYMGSIMPDFKGAWAQNRAQPFGDGPIEKLA
jgi:hypothetical protein